MGRLRLVNTGIILAALAILITTPLSAKTPGFRGLGDLPGGDYNSSVSAVSQDGRFIAGQSSSSLSGTWSEGVIWQPDGSMVPVGVLSGGLTNGSLFAISDDGKVAVGNSNTSSGPVAAKWTAETGLVSLQTPTLAEAISADGSVIGITRQSDWHGFCYINGNMTDLGDLAGGSYYCDVKGVSADGNVIVGTSASASGFEPYVWTSSGGMIGLGDLPGGAFHAGASGVTRDGSIVIGHGSTAEGDRAFRWTSEQGMIALADLPSGGSEEPRSISDDGCIVVGKARDHNGDQFAAIWINDMAYPLKDYLEGDLGLDLTGWKLHFASDISGDGTIIVGRGRNPSGANEAFIATIPEPATVSLLGIGALSLMRRRRR